MMWTNINWINSDCYHGENLPKHPDAQILESWEKETEEKNEEDEP